MKVKLKMETKAFSEDDVKTYLLNKAELDGFYISECAGIVDGQIGYVDRNGAAWSLMEDNNSLVDACILFLKKRGNQVFSDVASEDQFVEKLQERFSNS